MSRPEPPATRGREASADEREALRACGLPESDGAAFSAPWQAQAFALAVALHEAGHFEWSEWAQYLSQAIRDAQAAGDPDLGDTYWQHWVSALERLLRDKGLAQPLQLSARREALRAYPRVSAKTLLFR